MIEIELVRTPEQADTARDLANEFIGWLRGRYPELAAEIDRSLEHRNFRRNFAKLLKSFTPPRGECLIAVSDGEPVGIVMMRGRRGGRCEMTRLYVRDGKRRRGTGRALVERLKQRAVEMGFETMVLSALRRHYEALALFRSCGFGPEERRPEAGNQASVMLMRFELQAGGSNS